jgi:hypothetical protein
LELLFRQSEVPTLGVSASSGVGFEGSRTVLEGFLLPAVEHHGVDTMMTSGCSRLEKAWQQIIGSV